MAFTDMSRGDASLADGARVWGRAFPRRNPAALLVAALAVFCPRMVAAGEDLVDLTTPDNGIITSCSSHTSYSGAKAFDDGSVSDEKSRWLVVKSNDTLTNA